MNILVTGIHGFVGSNLVVALKERHSLYAVSYTHLDVYKRQILLSAHREENIETEKNFSSLFTAINRMAEKYDMPIPVSYTHLIYFRSYITIAFIYHIAELW